MAFQKLLSKSSTWYSQVLIFQLRVSLREKWHLWIIHSLCNVFYCLINKWLRSCCLFSVLAGAWVAGAGLSRECRFADLRKIANCYPAMQALSRTCPCFNQFRCVLGDGSNHGRIHLRSAVSALPRSEPVLAPWAARWIVRTLFSCGLTASYSSECRVARNLCDFFWFILFLKDIVQLEWG